MLFSFSPASAFWVPLRRHCPEQCSHAGMRLREHWLSSLPLEATWGGFPDPCARSAPSSALSPRNFAYQQLWKQDNRHQMFPQYYTHQNETTKRQHETSLYEESIHLQQLVLLLFIPPFILFDMILVLMTMNRCFECVLYLTALWKNACGRNEAISFLSIIIAGLCYPNQ